MFLKVCSNKVIAPGEGIKSIYIDPALNLPDSSSIEGRNFRGAIYKITAYPVKGSLIREIKRKRPSRKVRGRPLFY
jgi:hypothetical protein